ncbi:hypothetical protein E1J53_0014520 [Lewinella sp. W8]|nr:hypothetical protein [Lewinella sp. W8]
MFSFVVRTAQNMKGIVFTEFLDMVEREFGEITVEEVIDGAEVPSGGAYTAVGSYPASEMVQLVSTLSKHQQIPVSTLLEKFGHSLFLGLHRNYPHFFESGDLFEFLASIHTYIHVEVKKLYRDAELPSLVVLDHQPNRLVLLYESPRKMADLARGLLQASIDHYPEQEVQLEEEWLDDTGGKVQFTLIR